MRCSLCYCGCKLCWYLHIYETKQDHIILPIESPSYPTGFCRKNTKPLKMGTLFPSQLFSSLLYYVL